MIYFTGDTHGSVSEIVRFCVRFHLTSADTIVILGDVGANYDAGEHDRAMKKALGQLKPTIFCIHGNHEFRPSSIPSYKTKEWHGGTVWYEDAYPNLIFARDGDIYTMDGLRYLVIGGAYSVDKFYRLRHGYGWWDDEQPSAEIKAYVERQIREKPFDMVLSHTCPFKYEPTEVFLPMIDQSTVDASTEHWLDQIEEAIEYQAWFCGHWHVNKRIDKMHFLFHDFESAEQFSQGKKVVP